MEDFIPYGTQKIDDNEIEEVVKTLKSGWLTSGPKVKEFEDALCGYIGCKYAVAVNSGTSALDMAVKSLDLPAGSEVITTPFTFVADSNLTEKTKAIIYVDYAGQPCRINEIKKIAEEHCLFLIEDACHAVGAEYNGKKIGNFADMTVLSFHPVKHITTGEGGAILSDNEDLAKKLRMLRNHGIDKAPADRDSWVYDMKDLGRNYRITDIQCTLGVTQLKKIEWSIERRQTIAKRYNEELSKLNWVKIPSTSDSVRHAWHLYTILIENGNREDFFYYMKKNNIGVNLHYIPSYRFSYYRKKFNFFPKDYPVTEKVFSEIITLPMYPSMTEEQVERVINLVKRYK
ncbi:DegT/DnrJ/EryC1/StrS family aminotransferase [Candidatus Pacearchaeota archaeon]|nr:DegT/DnrJ/EryC1/StrS family aminotransferase [Candidatus Pacearchaeota archaeon]